MDLNPESSPVIDDSPVRKKVGSTLGSTSLSRPSTYLRIFKSNVFVRDLDLSLKFYVDQLGFKVVADALFDFGRWVAIAPPMAAPFLR